MGAIALCPGDLSITVRFAKSPALREWRIVPLGCRRGAHELLMNLEKVIFGFFIVLALTLNVAFVVGDFAIQEHHSIWLLFAAVVINLIATILKLGDRSQVGTVLLATALVADLQLLTASMIWAFAESSNGLADQTFAIILSLATGALVANLVSVTLLVTDSLMSGR